MVRLQNPTPQEIQTPNVGLFGVWIFSGTVQHNVPADQGLKQTA